MFFLLRFIYFLRDIERIRNWFELTFNRLAYLFFQGFYISFFNIFLFRTGRIMRKVEWVGNRIEFISYFHTNLFFHILKHSCLNIFLTQPCNMRIVKLKICLNFSIFCIPFTIHWSDAEMRSLDGFFSKELFDLKWTFSFLIPVSDGPFQFFNLFLQFLVVTSQSSCFKLLDIQMLQSLLKFPIFSILSLFKFFVSIFNFRHVLKEFLISFVLLFNIFNTFSIFCFKEWEILFFYFDVILQFVDNIQVLSN